ncbi:MAG: integrating conjugative element protein [Gammaproteobacteria bacterium]
MIRNQTHRVPAKLLSTGLILATMASTSQALDTQQTATATSRATRTTPMTNEAGAQGNTLTVLHTGTDKISAMPYFEAITAIRDKGQSERRILDNAKRKLDTIRMPDTPISLNQFFPLKSQRLQVGQPTVKYIDKLTTPIFIIGMDTASLTWLEDSSADLKKINAVGIVVQAESSARFATLKARARKHGLHLEIGFGDPLADGYGLETYPVLIKRTVK